MNSLRRGRYILSEVKNRVTSGVTHKPIWFDAMTKMPPPTSPLVSKHKIEDIVLPEDEYQEKLVELFPKFQNSPLRFVPGTAKYYTHPVQFYVSLQTRLMQEEHLSADEAFEKVCDEVRTQDLYEHLQRRVQTKQAVERGVQLTNLQAELLARQAPYLDALRARQDYFVKNARDDLVALARERLAELENNPRIAKLSVEDFPSVMSGKDRDMFFVNYPELKEAFEPSVSTTPHELLSVLPLTRETVEKVAELDVEIRAIEERTGAEMSAVDKSRLLELLPTPRWVSETLRESGLSSAQAHKGFQAFVAEENIGRAIKAAGEALSNQDMIELGTKLEKSDSLDVLDVLLHTQMFSSSENDTLIDSPVRDEDTSPSQQ